MRAGHRRAVSSPSTKATSGGRSRNESWNTTVKSKGAITRNQFYSQVPLTFFLSLPYLTRDSLAFCGYEILALQVGDFMKTLGFIALVLGTLLTFKAPGGGAEGPRYGGRLVFGIAKDITSLNPFYR